MFDQLTSKSLVQELCDVKRTGSQKWREFKEGQTYSSEQKLALADCVSVLQAIMSAKITKSDSGMLGDSELIDNRLRSMLSVFGVTSSP